MIDVGAFEVYHDPVEEGDFRGGCLHRCLGGVLSHPVNGRDVAVGRDRHRGVGGHQTVDHEIDQGGENLFDQTGRYLFPRISSKDSPLLTSVPTTARMPSLNPNLTLAALQVRS